MKNQSIYLLLVILALLGFSSDALAIYNPETGRFLSLDPIAERGGVNLYGFVSNDPINKWDYLGLYGENVSIPNKAPNCQVIIHHTHGPTSAIKWRNEWQSRAEEMVYAAGGSLGTIDNRDIRDTFYGRSAVLGCKHQLQGNERWWIPGVKDSGGGYLGFLGSPITPPPPGGIATITNGGYGTDLQAYLSYVRDSWAAALRAADDLAKKCKSDPCCQCKEITAKFEASIVHGANGRTTRDIWDTARSSQVGHTQGAQQANSNIPNPAQQYPNLDPTHNTNGEGGVPLYPGNGATVKFKVR